MDILTLCIWKGCYVMEVIHMEMLERFQNAYEQKKTQKAVRHAIFNNSLDLCVSVQENLTKNQNHFSVNIDTMKVANQLTSGRCWIFAGLNVLRENIAKRLGLTSFELSQNYLAFYDKLEKINMFLNLAIEMSDRDIDDRTYVWLLTNGVQDGGQWDMFVNLVEKYGVVPKDIMPETFQSSNTAPMNVLINTRMHKFAQEVRNLKELGKMDEIESLRLAVLEEMYGFLCTCFGIPPKVFNFSYMDKDGDVHHMDNLTPKEFYKEQIQMDLCDYISVIHAPTKDKPFHESYRVKYLSHADGKPVQYLNVPMDELKEVVIKQLKDGQLVWFGSDCSKFNDKKGGFWDDRSFDYDTAFEIDFYMDKESALDMRDSAMNHAMVLSGVDLLDEQPLKWKIENSWGDAAGHLGYFVASDTWFERFVYQAVIHRKYLKKEHLEDLKKEPKELEPWDPMGTLAD